MRKDFPIERHITTLSDAKLSGGFRQVFIILIFPEKPETHIAMASRGRLITTNGGT
jgi:hypothetical protein